MRASIVPSPFGRGAGGEGVGSEPLITSDNRRGAERGEADAIRLCASASRGYPTLPCAPQPAGGVLSYGEALTGGGGLVG